MDKAKQENTKTQLKEDIKHRHKGVGLKKNKRQIDKNEKTHAKTRSRINKISKLKSNKQTIIHIDMPYLKWIANNIKTINNELDKAKQQK